jgi:phytoene/squalene synthetase
LRLFGTRAGAKRFFLVYAYFRWADDLVDAPERQPARVRAFMKAQLARLDRGEVGPELAERCLGQALAESDDERLAQAVRTMARALDFDASRKGDPIRPDELQAQIRRVGDAYTLALLHAAEVTVPVPSELFLLARAATATHHLRDLLIDQDLGYLNLPQEHAERHGLPVRGFTAAALGPYIRERAEVIRPMFHQGLRASEGLPLRARLLFRLFAWRYRRLLDRLAYCSAPALTMSPVSSPALPPTSTQPI